MPELTPYKVKEITIRLTNPPRLKFNAGGVLYVKGMTEHGGVEVRFPADISVSDDVRDLGYAKLVRADQPISKPVRETSKKPVRDTSPEPKPVTADKPEPQPQEQEPASDGNAKRKFDLFKL